MYEIKNVKTFHGHDGGCWEATLYCDSKRIAIVTEDGWGGDLQFHWLNPLYDTDSQALTAFALTLPKWELSDGEMTNVTPAIYVSDLVNAFLITKDVKKVLKKFAISSSGKIYTWNAKPDDQRVRLFVAKNHPDAIILNDVTLEKAVELYTATGVGT